MTIEREVAGVLTDTSAEIYDDGRVVTGALVFGCGPFGDISSSIGCSALDVQVGPVPGFERRVPR